MGCASVPWWDSRQGHLFRRLHRRRARTRGGVAGSCFLLAAVGGVQPPGSWYPSTIIWLQGFSSRSPAAVPCRRSPRRMTTSLAVGRSKPGCGLSPTLSFKDVHHPRCGGRRVESGPYPPYGLVTRFFLQHSEGKGAHQSCGGDFGYMGPAECRLSAASCLAL
jgi:hypothetical protein